MLSKITTYVADVRDRILTQYKDTTTQQLIEAFALEMQTLEDAIWDLGQQTTLGYPTGAGYPTGTPATGMWLDYIGSIVGVARVTNISDFNDDVYRKLIYARILANKSSGTIEEVIAVAEIANVQPGTIAHLTEDFPAGLVINIGFNVDDFYARNVASEVRRARPAGVRTHLLSSPAPLPNTFTFSTTSVEETNLATAFSETNTLGDGGLLSSSISA